MPSDPPINAENAEGPCARHDSDEFVIVQLAREIAQLRWLLDAEQGAHKCSIEELNRLTPTASEKWREEQEELKRLRERVGPVSPQGDDYVDELESANGFLRYRSECAERKLSVAKEALEAAWKYLQPDLVEPGRTVFWKIVDALRTLNDSTEKETR